MSKGKLVIYKTAHRIMSIKKFQPNKWHMYVNKKANITNIKKHSYLLQNQEQTMKKVGLITKEEHMFYHHIVFLKGTKGARHHVKRREI